MSAAAAGVPDLLHSLLAASRHMLALANDEKWDELAEHEPLRREQMAKLKLALDRSANGQAPAIQNQSRILVREILDSDARIQELIENRLSDLGKSFQSVEVSKRLNSAYLHP